jgi:hypothetical protein
MLDFNIPVTIALVYATGATLSAAYHMLRLSELKLEHDSTRVKDTKNDCVALARHHVHELTRSWIWPAGLFDMKALSWSRSLGKK